MIPILPGWANGRVEAAAVQQAAAALRRGGLVGMPTETVYGLAALARDRSAVARIYEVKGRPSGHPLIVHVAGAADIDVWSAQPAAYARALAEALWPGPLTLVLPRRSEVGDYLTGGQDTIALRCPAHPTALALIAAAGPLAAPSANRFGRVSPTTAAAVAGELGDRLRPGLDLVVNGGPCPVGVESTILDCTGAQPVVLRWGAVETSDIESVAGRDLLLSGSPARAPGTLPSHYAPAARVRLVGPAPQGAGFLALAGIPTPPGCQRLAAPSDIIEYAAVLYRALRNADERGLADVLAVAPPEDCALGRAVTDRLRRAAHAG